VVVASQVVLSAGNWTFNWDASFLDDLTLLANTSVAIGGDASVASVNFSASAFPLTVSGSLTISGNTSLVVQVESLVLASSMTFVVVVALASQIQGNFSSISAVSSCFSLDVLPSYSSSSLSVVVSVSGSLPCQSELDSNLSTGQVIGICVGTVVAGAVVAVAIVLLSKIFISSYTTRANEKIRSAAVGNMQEDVVLTK
jgi:hypothetical protein